MNRKEWQRVHRAKRIAERYAFYFELFAARGWQTLQLGDSTAFLPPGFAHTDEGKQ